MQAENCGVRMSKNHRAAWGSSTSPLSSRTCPSLYKRAPWTSDLFPSGLPSTSIPSFPQIPWWNPFPLSSLLFPSNKETEVPKFNVTKPKLRERTVTKDYEDKRNYNSKTTIKSTNLEPFEKIYEEFEILKLQFNGWNAKIECEKVFCYVTCSDQHEMKGWKFPCCV